MPQAFDTADQEWWRFDRYEIRDGYIRPSAKAELESYRPWERYRAAADDPRGQCVRPYQELFQLVSDYQAQFDLRPGQPALQGGDQIAANLNARPDPLQLEPEMEAKVTAWCARHGLLGLLPHRTQSIELAPRWEGLCGSEVDAEMFQSPHSCTEEMGEPQTLPLIPATRRYTRTAQGWRQNCEYPSDGSSPDVQCRRHGELVTEDDCPAYRPPFTMVRGLFNSEWSREPVYRTWGPFFPTVPRSEADTYPYPLPLSESFWRLYQERIDWFLEAATLLRDSVFKLSDWRNAAQRETANTEAVEIMKRAARGMRADVLNSMIAESTTIVTAGEDGSVMQRWRAHSLLGCLAMMAVQDLTERQRIFRCVVCGKPCVTSAYQAEYCSDRCRHTAQKRRYRARKRTRDAQAPSRTGGHHG